MKRVFCLLLSALLFVGALSLSSCKKDNGPVSVVIDVENYGKITVELYPDIAPITVENFLSLVDAGFYNGLTFHRLYPGFMAQGGDPKGNGKGGSANKIKGEFSKNGVKNTLSHTRGVISMARATDYDSASTQFFICVADATHLDGAYAAFGKVTSGMEVVDAMMTYVLANQSVFTTNDSYYYSNGAVKAEYQPVITSITRAEK